MWDESDVFFWTAVAVLAVIPLVLLVAIFFCAAGRRAREGNGARKFQTRLEEGRGERPMRRGAARATRWEAMRSRRQCVCGKESGHAR